MKKIIMFITFLLALTFTGCNVIQDTLVILETPEVDSVVNNPELNIPIDHILYQASVDKTKTILSHIPKDLFPLAISADYANAVTMQRNMGLSNDENNQKVILGHMQEYIDLQMIDLSDDSVEELGTYLTLRDYKFDENGRLFAFVDGLGNVYLYSLDTTELKKIVSAEQYPNITSLDWSRDSKRLMFDTKLIFDISSNEFISLVATSYTPFPKYKFSDELYVVQMKNYLYNNIISIYNMTTQTYKTITNGNYIDCDGTYLLYTTGDNYGLNLLNLKTMENKIIHDGIIYSADLLKSTGEIIYSSISTDNNRVERYLIRKFTPATSEKPFTSRTIYTNTPSYYLSPSEDNISLVSDFLRNNYSIALSTFSPQFYLIDYEKYEMVRIKNTIIKMFLLDYSSITNYAEYEQRAKTIYTNNYTTVPLEALENKLIDFKRYGHPSKDKNNVTIPAQLSIVSFHRHGDFANIVINAYTVNSLDFVYEKGNWFIAGFSTHADSAELQSIIQYLTDYLDLIKNKQLDDLKSYDGIDQTTITQLLNRADHITLEVGEIEFWMPNGIHRAANTSVATNIRAKIIIKSNVTTEKYKVLLQKTSKGYTIVTWDSDPLSISSY